MHCRADSFTVGESRLYFLEEKLEHLLIQDFLLAKLNAREFN